MHGWLNLYKPQGISSARAVAVIKSALRKCKIGHCGTLDVEASGVLPVAVGEATKLTRMLVDAKKTYIFTIKFGATTDTADASGEIIATTTNLPSAEQCNNICSQFIGAITQTPPRFSAIKIHGTRAYTLARQGCQFEIAPRTIQIYHLNCLEINTQEHIATYIVQCSKGTYIRALAEDIALSLKSLGFVLELRRIQVGQFTESNSLQINELLALPQSQLHSFLEANMLETEAVLDDIPVLEATQKQMQQIRCGMQPHFSYHCDLETCWVKYNNLVLSIGSLTDNCFKSWRVFNLN